MTVLPLTRPYSINLQHPRRLLTREVRVGHLPLGGLNPIRLQSMTTTDTMDTAGTVAQALRMAQAGCEYIRITAPSLKEAENLAVIKAELRRLGCNAPLVADIHFTPNAAEAAARIVEKVRINPGNYADKKRFEQLEYSDASYAEELMRIHKRFTPLVKICKEHGTAMRIGTNHGSLSDRILSRYGDTPTGMVESALEFVHICEAEGFYELVISMKASNPQVMVQAYRLLVQRMLAGDTTHIYPLHLGVTEAGEGEDGRIKSALGIGALLADGLGDTIRVSLTEPPEAEIPVARYLARHFTLADPPSAVPEPLPDAPAWDPYQFKRRLTVPVLNIGGDNLSRVISYFPGPPPEEREFMEIGHYYSFSLDKWHMNDQGADFVAADEPLTFMPPNGLKTVYPAAVWQAQPEREHAYPLYESLGEFLAATEHSKLLNFLIVNEALLAVEKLHTVLVEHPVVLVVDAAGPGAAVSLRNVGLALLRQGITNPLVAALPISPAQETAEDYAHRFYLTAAANASLALVDGWVDGLWIWAAQTTEAPEVAKTALANRTAFSLLQAARLRSTRTEYISCPSCGRTLFDLQETTALIRSRTEHLKGVKIGIMGCIVNGPGEMADADYGYVGAGLGIISLWRGKEQVAAKVPAAQAVDRLIALIQQDGRWVEQV